MKNPKLATKFGAIFLAFVIMFSTVPVATAVPADKVAQAEAVKKEIDKLDQNLEIAVERYNDANQKHADLVKKRDETAAKIEKIQGEIAATQAKLSDRASSMYRQGQYSFLDVLLGARSFEDFATLWDTLNQLNDADVSLVEKMNKLEEEEKDAKAKLEEQEIAAKEQLKIAANEKSAIQGKLAERKQKLSGIESEIAALRRQEEAAASARAATQIKVAARDTTQIFPTPTRHARGEVVAVAKQYLGAPYVWGATGPNSFDCSGFTSFVYRQCGVSIPRTSRAQINAGPRVSVGDLQPGDLVFFGSPIHHVGIYIGGGQYIHAPTTGDVVKISSLFSNSAGFSGACRP